MIFMLFNMVACITLDISVTPSQTDTSSIGPDTADTQIVETGNMDETGEVPDTADTEETDTQDTDTNDQPDQYTSDELMMGNYLEFKDDLFLVNYMNDGHSLYANRNFLRFNSDWAFAVSLMPYDPRTANLLAWENNQDGHEIALFVSGNNLFTLQFVHFEDMPGMYRPIVRLVSKGAGNITCGYIQLEQPFDQANGGIANAPMYTREEIVGGLRIASSYSAVLGAPMNTLKLYINNPDQPAIDVSFATPVDCNMDDTANLANVRFGLGATYFDDAPVPNERMADYVQAKVDNLVVFDLSYNTCTPDWNPYFYPAEPTVEDPDKTEDMMVAMDCLSGQEHIDGFHLWAMDPQMDPENIDQINSNIIQDVSELEMNPPNVVFNFRIHKGTFRNNDSIPPNQLEQYFQVREVTE